MYDVWRPFVALSRRSSRETADSAPTLAPLLFVPGRAGVLAARGREERWARWEHRWAARTSTVRARCAVLGLANFSSRPV